MGITSKPDGTGTRPATGYSNNLVSSMRMNLNKNPDMLAIICEERAETWAEMWDAHEPAEQWSAQIRSKERGPGGHLSQELS